MVRLTLNLSCLGSYLETHSPISLGLSLTQRATKDKETILCWSLTHLSQVLFRKYKSHSSGSYCRVPLCLLSLSFPRILKCVNIWVRAGHLQAHKSWEQGLNLNRSWHMATLMRTIPRSILSHIQRICLFPYLKLFWSATTTGLFPWSGCTIVCSWTRGPNVNQVTSEKQHIAVFSLDSGLEAFSRNPAHGSFSALTFQSTEFANYVNQRFLSY